MKKPLEAETWKFRAEGIIDGLTFQRRWNYKTFILGREVRHKKGKKDNGIIQEYSQEEKEHLKILFIYYESKLCGKN